MTTDAAEGREAGWGEWRNHDGGKCPIAWAKVGDYQALFGDGLVLGHIRARDWRWKWKDRNNASCVTAYRVRADLEHRLTDAPATGGVQVTDEMRRAARAVGESKAPQLGAVSIAFADMCEEALTAALAAAPRQTETPNV